MTTNFPSSLDSFTNPSATDAMDSVTVPHADQHADLNDAMEAVQAKLGVGAGTSGEWTSYTPTFTNMTASSTSFEYAVVNELVFVRVYAVIATMGSSPTFSVPIAVNRSPMFQRVGLLETGLQWFDGLVLLNTSTTFYLMCIYTAGTYATYAGITATVPFTWGAGDAIDGVFVYGKA